MLGLSPNLTVIFCLFPSRIIVKTTLSFGLFEPIIPAQGLGFAVPVNMLKNILPKLKKDGKVYRGWVGIVMQPLDEQLAASFGLSDTKGVLIADVTKGEPGDNIFYNNIASSLFWLNIIIICCCLVIAWSFS